MVESPAPLISHSVEELPARQFSATIPFAGAVHGSAACALRPGERATIVTASNRHSKAYFVLFMSEAFPMRSVHGRHAMPPVHVPTFASDTGYGVKTTSTQ